MKNPTNKKQKPTVINAQPIFYYDSVSTHGALTHTSGALIAKQTVIDFLEAAIKSRIKDPDWDWGLCSVIEDAGFQHDDTTASYVAFCFCRMLKLQVPPDHTCEDAVALWGELLDLVAYSNDGLYGCKYATHRTVLPPPYHTKEGKTWRFKLLRMLVAFLKSRPEETIQEMEDNIRFDADSEVRSEPKIVAAYVDHRLLTLLRAS